MESSTGKERPMIMRSVLIISMLFTYMMIYSQDVDTSQFETFDYVHKDSTFIMQKYFLAFLMRGDKESPDEKTRTETQNAHLAYLGGLFEKGIITMNGPFGDDGEIRGATVYRVSTLEEARRLAEGDPAVQAGVLKVEVHPWWLARGSGVR